MFDDFKLVKKMKKLNFSNLENYTAIIRLIQTSFIFMAVTLVMYKLTQIFTDYTSFFHNINGYNEPLLDDSDLKIDLKKTESEDKIILPEKHINLEFDLKAESQSKYYIIFKYTGYIIGAGIITFGIWYLLSKLGTTVDTMADVAQKGLDECKVVNEEATKAALDAMTSIAPR